MQERALGPHGRMENACAVIMRSHTKQRREDDRKTTSALAITQTMGRGGHLGQERKNNWQNNLHKLGEEAGLQSFKEKICGKNFYESLTYAHEILKACIKKN